MAESVATYDFLSPPTESGDLGTLAHYRVIDELGKGGMGYVFRAQDSKLQRNVALKVMNQKIAATSNSRSRFIHEARAMAAVRHDNVATIFEVGESDGTPFMAMEMLRGGTLEAFNKDHHRLDYERIIDYAQQIAQGLAAAHEKGIVHRDIKPANIWIEEGIDRIKILDFGLALASTPVDHLSGRGAVIGTPGYLSPEQARSEPLDDRSDLYSLGVVLYELATGQLPLQSGSVSGQLIAILAHRPTPVDELNPAIPKPLCDLIHRLLRKEPRLRPQTAVALDAELDQVREQCEATSKVAQAINKLQVGLTQVVNQSDSDSLIDAIDDIPETVADPLSNLPAAATSQVGPASSGRFVVPTSAQVKAKAEPEGPNWKLYAPLIAIVALIVTILPATAFFFSQTGRSTEPIVVTELGDGLLPIEPRPSPNQTVDPPAIATIPPPDKVSAAETTPVPGSTQAPGSTSAPESSAPESSARRSAEKKPVDAAQGNDASPNRTADPPTAEELTKVDVASEAAKPVTKSPPDRTEDPDRSPAPSPSTERPPADSPPNTPDKKAPTAPPKSNAANQFQQRIFSFRDKNYADVTLRKGTTVNLGSKETIDLRTRGGVEVEHIYLRFDLAAIKGARKTVDQAELVLTAAGDRPLGTSIRLYGVPLAEELILWPESKVVWLRSPSDIDTETAPEKTLNDFPVLGKQTVGKPKKPTDRSRIRFSSSALAKFIADSPHDVITLVLAGSAEDGKARVEFISSESPARKTKAPLLRLRFVKQPPKPAGEKETEDPKPTEAGEPLSKKASQIIERVKRNRANRKKP